MQLSLRQPAALAARGGRVRTLAPATSRRAQQRVLRAAEAEAPAEEQQPGEAADAAEEAAAALADDFSFNYTDAKRGNQWQPSDVQAALDYYADEKFLQGSTELPYEAEFVTNPLSAYVGGPEDSSWLADVDNNEAYENDDYALAGIPEAAPKVKRGNQRDDDDGADDEALRAVEDEKISAAAFDDVEGFEDDGDDSPEAAWNWRLEGGDATDVSLPAAGSKVSDDEAFLDSLSLDLSAHDDLTLEQKDLLSVVLDPVAADGGGLELIGEQVDEPDADVPGLSKEEEASIAALLAEGVDTSALLAAARAAPDLADDVAAAAEEARAYGGPLAPAAVQEYLRALDAVDAATAGADDATVAALLGGDEAEPVAAGGPQLGAAPALPDVSAALAQGGAEPERFAAEPAADEAAAGEAIGLLADVEALAADVDEYSELVFPADQDLEEYGRLVDAALEYYEAAGDDAGGPLAERPEDAPVNAYEDIDPALLGAPGALGEGEGPSFDRDGGQFVERILELGRVTKVVKGGKLMGFRCVAVVGDGKGRVGVGCQAGREVSTAVKRALVDAKKSLVEVPLVGAGTIPHRVESWFKAAGVVLLPAADGTGVIAGGAVRAVLELAGVQNVLGKRLGGRSTLNNARVTLKALSELRTMEDAAKARGIPLDYMLS